MPAAPAGSSAAPVRQWVSLWNAQGSYNSADVWVTAPETWSEVVTDLVGVVQGAEVVLQTRKLGDVRASRNPTTGAFMGLLYAVRGRPVSKYFIRAYCPDVALSGTATCVGRVGWNMPASSDQGFASVRDLYARADQQWLFTTEGAGLTAADQQIIVANPRGAGFAITAIHVSSIDGALSGRVVLGALIPAGFAALWSCALPTFGSVSQQFPQPLYLPNALAGASLRVHLLGGIAGAPGNVELSLEGFYR